METKNVKFASFEEFKDCLNSENSDNLRALDSWLDEPYKKGIDSVEQLKLAVKGFALLLKLEANQVPVKYLLFGRHYKSLVGFVQILNEINELR